MKTAIQEAISELQKSIEQELEVLEIPSKYHPQDVSTARYVVEAVNKNIAMLTKILPKEREQIKQAGNKCQIVNDVNIDGNINFMYKSGEDYYNKTFKPL